MMHSVVGDCAVGGGKGRGFARAQENVPVNAGQQPCRFSIGLEDSPGKGRAFGEEIHANCIIDTSLLSMESRDFPSTSFIADDHTSVAASDCGTEVSSVAMLRGWLDDFGKQNKDHYKKNSKLGKAPTDVELEKPTRPKISRTTAHVPPTPLPPVAAQKLKRMMETPSSATIASARSSSRQSRPHPLRFKSKMVRKEDVQATDSGYASVAKLSAWLADDPTKTKKVRHLRRGANVIAKSRKFDKALENVVVEQDTIPRGRVSDRADWLEQKSSGSEVGGSTDFETSSEVVLSSLASMSKKEQFNDSATTISVMDKRKWLASAFEKKGEGKAQTELVTAQDQRDAVSSRAKQMWRSKRTPTKYQRTPPRRSVKKSDKKESRQIQVDIPRPRSIFREPPPAEEKKEEEKQEEKKEEETHEEKREVEKKEEEKKEEKTPEVDFHAARRLLVQRSKMNGNAVEVASKVQRRKAKFERLEKESRRKSSPTGLLKPSWEDFGDGRRTSYVKKFVEDICPKKSFEELP